MLSVLMIIVLHPIYYSVLFCANLLFNWLVAITWRIRSFWALMRSIVTIECYSQFYYRIDENLRSMIHHLVLGLGSRDTILLHITQVSDFRKC